MSRYALPGLTRRDYLRRPNWPPKVEVETPSRAVSKERAEELKAEWRRIAEASPRMIGIGPEKSR